MNPLKFLPLAWQLGVYLVALGVVAGGIGAAIAGFIHHERRIGWDGALAQVARQDAHAKAIAIQAAQDVDECERNGGSFDVSSGDCSK
jgi:hypothetical protein